MSDDSPAFVLLETKPEGGHDFNVVKLKFLDHLL
jgi:hypothetical protein